MYGRTWKIFPKLYINQDIMQFEILSLKCIICHDGKNLNSDHYRASVKCNGKWYLMVYI